MFGVKAHIVYDPQTDQPIYFAVTKSKVNDITAAKAMPIEPGATYVYDLGYYDYGWWAALDDAGCRFVTRLKNNTPLTVVHVNRVPPQRSDRPPAATARPQPPQPVAGAGPRTSRDPRKRQGAADRYQRS